MIYRITYVAAALVQVEWFGSRAAAERRIRELREDDDVESPPDDEHEPVAIKTPGSKKELLHMLNLWCDTD
jgi:hypothetical protein